jgi:hypothetical protein
MNQATLVPIPVFTRIGVLFRDDERASSTLGSILPPPDGITSDEFAAFMDAQTQI